MPFIKTLATWLSVNFFLVNELNMLVLVCFFTNLTFTSALTTATKSALSTEFSTRKAQKSP
jgi:hypothetical protein